MTLETNSTSPLNLFLKQAGLQVIYPAQRFTKPNVNFHALESIAIQSVETQRLAEFIIEFLNAPVIIDQFNKDHDTRRLWRKNVENSDNKEVLQFLYSNKLRKGLWGTPMNTFFAKIAARKDKTNNPGLLNKFKNFEIRYRSIVQGYAEMDITEKLETIKKLDELFRNILDELK